MKSLSFKLLKLCRTKLSKVTVPRPRAKCAWKATPLWLGGGLQWGHAERGVSARQITVTQGIESVRACVGGWIYLIYTGITGLQRRTTIRKEFLMSHNAIYSNQSSQRLCIPDQPYVSTEFFCFVNCRFVPQTKEYDLGLGYESCKDANCTVNFKILSQLA